MQVAKQCKEAGSPAVEIYSVDLTSAKDIDRVCSEMLGKHAVDVLVSDWQGRE